MGNIIKKFDQFSINEKKKCDTKECDTKKSDSSKSDEEIYLTPKQRKLPEGLKKGIIAKYKKNPKKTEDKEDIKEEKEPKKIDISKSDEENYLSPKQRKLPEGLKKGIIAKNKKKTKKVNEGLEDDILSKIVEFINPCNLEDSKEYDLRTWWDDEDEIENLSNDTILDYIEILVFNVDSDTSNEFGYEFIIDHKDEILEMCKTELENCND